MVCLGFMLGYGYYGEVGKGALTEESKQEEYKHHRNTNGFALLPLGTTRRLRNNGSDDEHADPHTDTTNDEQELAPIAIDGPGGVEREEDGKSGVERIDERDRRRVRKHLLVDLGRVGVERALAGDLLTCVEHKGEEQALAHRAIFPERRVARGYGFFFELERFADGQDFVFDFLLRVADFAQGGAGVFDAFTVLEVPARGLEGTTSEQGAAK